MKKIMLFITTILLLFLLVSCNNNNNNSNDDIETIVPSVFKNPNVSKLEFVNVPNQAIEIGHFSEQNIKLKATYLDGSTSYQKVTEALFSDDELEKFLTPGEKFFDFIYKGGHLPLRFTLKESQTPIYFTVTFKNYNNNLLQEKTVKYLSSVLYSGKTDSINYSLNDKYYRFNGNWTENLNHIFTNLVAYPEYDICDYQNDFENHYNVVGYPVIASSSNGSFHNSLLYLGRANDVMIDKFDPIKRSSYERNTYEYDIYDSDITNTYKMFSSRICDSLISNYVHEKKHIYYDGMINNSYLLDFNLSKDKSQEIIDEERNEKYIAPSFFIDDFSNKDYQMPDNGINRYDNTYSSIKNILDINDSNPYQEYHKASATNLSLTQDYPLGFYKLLFICDIDCYLDIEYRVVYFDPYVVFELYEVNLAFCYVEDSLKFEAKYSLDGNYYTYNNPFTISNWILAESLYMYHNN